MKERLRGFKPSYKRHDADEAEPRMGEMPTSSTNWR
jgi:hypothetical protein